MNIEEAIQKAIEFERKICNVYEEALASTTNPAAIKIYRLMKEEEELHVIYLEQKLEAWRTDKALYGGDLKTALPDAAADAEPISALPPGENHLDPDSEMGVLARVYKAELETSEFYAEMAANLSPEGRDFFNRFVEVERGHLRLVAAEIDSLRGIGRWFDLEEFKLENA